MSKSATTNSPEPQVDRDALTRERIVSYAHETFLKFGFSKVTMEEIAQALAISKKTLYKHFSNKDDLLRAVVMRVMQIASREIDPIIDDPKIDFLHKMRAMSEFVARQSGRVSRVMMEDISRNAPQVWKEIDSFRLQRLAKLARLMREGAKSGVLKKDVNEEIAVRMYLASIQALVNPETIIELNMTPTAVFESIFTIFFYGLMTDAGRKQFDKITTGGTPTRRKLSPVKNAPVRKK